MGDLGKFLILVGGLCILTGIVLLVGGRVPWIGRLPGDISIERDHFHFYFPLTTCIVISIFLTLIVYLLRR